MDSIYDQLTRLLQPVAALFDVASVEVMALRLMGAALVLLAAFWISTTTQRYLVRRLHGHDEGQKETIRLYRRIVQAVAYSSVVFRVLVWIEDPWISGRLRSELNEAIWWALKDADVVIAFPQLDLHIAPDAPADSLR